MKHIIIKLPVVCILVVMTLAGCKKKKDENMEVVNTCSKDNFGVVTVTFSDASVKHSILVTASNTSIARDKIVAKGKTSDTVRLAPGIYQINIAAVNDMNQSLQDETYKDRNVIQCGELKLDVNF